MDEKAGDPAYVRSAAGCGWTRGRPTGAIGKNVHVVSLGGSSWTASRAAAAGAFLAALVVFYVVGAGGPGVWPGGSAVVGFGIAWGAIGYRKALGAVVRVTPDAITLPPPATPARKRRVIPRERIQSVQIVRIGLGVGTRRAWRTQRVLGHIILPAIGSPFGARVASPAWNRSEALSCGRTERRLATTTHVIHCGVMVDSSSSDSNAPLPSDAELRILRHLWVRGEQTVHEVHDHLSSEWDVGYTTVLKLLQRLHGKGMVERRREGRAHVYRAVVTRERTERRVVHDFLERAMEGSLSGLLQRALPDKPADPEEIRELRRLLDEWAEGE